MQVTERAKVPGKAKARATGGRRMVAGSAQGGRPRLRLFALSAGVTGCLVAWGFLVWAAIDVGRTAREGDDRAAWLVLGLASLGAVACLFAGLLMAARVLRLVGLLSAAVRPQPRTSGGRHR